ncbi:MAG: VOC family protein [Syntrophobacteraceae bacterium]|nr:VOC family protein [Syntrophobacteraceae bacterium]
MRQKINVIGPGVNDIERAALFYEKGLGWKRSSLSQGDWIVFALGGVALALYPRKLLADDATLKDEPTGFPGITFTYNAKSEKEVDAVLEEVNKRGATIIKPAQKVFWGGYSGYFKDLDGHIFEVAYGPMFEFDEDDNLKL